MADPAYGPYDEYVRTKQELSERYFLVTRKRGWKRIQLLSNLFVSERQGNK